ncbi:hypothetical protein ABEB36_013867 [Hypothenemus hampei]|uniref:MoaB/Mog domain-containing protein n=1 Tax=Hypothenemus hampei TaxID=57062 RepID=A0ABD1E5U4_HYPHA
MAIRFGILTVSTTCFICPEKDRTGPELEACIQSAFPDCQIVFRKIVSDVRADIRQVLIDFTDAGTCDVIFTAGGTGFALSDVTPEATKDVIEKEAPGLTYAILAKSLGITEMAMLSRATAGIRKQTIILNFPGSVKASIESFNIVKPTFFHAVALLREDASQVTLDHNRIQQDFQPSKVSLLATARRPRKSLYPMLEVQEALKIIKEKLPPMQKIEELLLEDSIDRVLAEDIRASRPVPEFAASIKDGYAVKASDGTGLRYVKAVVAAGDAPDNELGPGEACRISTGAPVPRGADAVVQVEDTILTEASVDGLQEVTVNILIEPKLGQDIRQVGSDIAVDEVVLCKNRRITPSYLGVIAMLGFEKVKVIKRPCIGIVSTGNELVSYKDVLKPGSIYDSNKLSLLSLLKSYSYEAIDCGISKDHPDSVKLTLEKAFSKCDLVITTGGVSMGEFDLLKQVLEEDFGATIHVGRLNMKPGKPTVFATLSNNIGKINKAVFALPGNPVSCFVTTLLFVVPTLKYLENEMDFKNWPKVNVTLEHNISNKDARPEYVRMIVLANDEGALTGRSTGNQISSRLNSMVDATGLLLVPGHSTIKANTSVKVQLFRTLNL